MSSRTLSERASPRAKCRCFMSAPSLTCFSVWKMRFCPFTFCPAVHRGVDFHTLSSCSVWSEERSRFIRSRLSPPHQHFREVFRWMTLYFKKNSATFLFHLTMCPLFYFLKMWCKLRSRWSSRELVKPDTVSITLTFSYCAPSGYYLPSHLQL